MSIPAPFVWTDQTVQPEWVDENKHMNIAFYLKAFDGAFYDVVSAWGMDWVDVATTGFTTFTAEVHLTYKSELFLGDGFSVETLLLEFDRKRIRWFSILRKADETIAATCEQLHLFVDFHERRVVSMPDAFFDRLAAIKIVHDQLPRPPEAGRGIAIGSRPRVA